MSVAVADNTAFAAMEERLQQQMEERLQQQMQCLRSDFEAALADQGSDFEAALAQKEEQRIKAERTVEELSMQLQEFSRQNDTDNLASHRRPPHLRLEALHLAAGEDTYKEVTQEEDAPEDAPEADTELLDASGNFKSLRSMRQSARTVEFENRDLPLDMWGVAIMTLTRDFADIMQGGEGQLGAILTRFLYAMWCVALNFSLQVAILYWVDLYVVGESVYNIQGEYAKFHHDVFDKHGSFDLGKWEAWGGQRDTLCGAVLTKYVFLSVILFMWTGRMLGEFKTIIRLRKNISELPNAAVGATASFTVVPKDELFEVIALTGGTRFAVYVLVILPKIGIASYLTYIGCVWLTATMNFGALILNALALGFIIDIDLNILEFFLPQRTSANVEATKFAYPSKGTPTKEQDMQAMQRDYLRNIFFFVLTVGLTWTYLMYLQTVIPGFSFDIAEHCGNWFEDRFHPPCKPFESNCFPFGETA